MRPKLKAENPTWGISEFGKAVGQMYKELPAEEMKVLTDKVEAAKEEHKKAREEFEASDKYKEFLDKKKALQKELKAAEGGKTQDKKAKASPKAKAPRTKKTLEEESDDDDD